MRFPESFLDDIRERLPISEVIGRRVTFDKKKTNAAKGDYWACCPFHGENTPSFHCEDSKGRYYCFGCQASGDHFRFVTELEGVSFAEAVEQLAVQAGLPMPVMDPRQQEREEERRTLYDVMEMAAEFFRSQLHEPAGASARAYLRERGLSGAVQQEFGIGFAPENRNALKQFLAAKGVEAVQMEACGLVVSGEGIAVSYDRFRNRIMFPIEDSRGRVIAFGGRAMDPEAKAKYLNSPETELFKKSNVLYNYRRARQAKQQAGTLVVVEGYMDVIALHAAGIENAVAPLGTALTETHLAVLWKTVDEPVLCFDGDQAGVRAANRTTDLALPKIVTGKSLKFCLLPEGLDPDDFVKKYGAKEFREQLDHSLPLSEYLVARRLKGALIETPEQKAAVEKQVFDDVAQIRDPLLVRYFNTHIRFRLIEGFGLGGRRRERKTAGAPSAQGGLAAPKPSRKRRYRTILGLCVEYPFLFADYVEEIADVAFDDADERVFVQALYQMFVSAPEVTASEFYSDIDHRFYDVLERIHGDEITDLATYLEKNGSVPWSTQRGHRLYALFPMLAFDPPPFLVKELLELHLLEESREQLESQVSTYHYNSDRELGLGAFEERRDLGLAYEQKVRRVDNFFQLLAGRDHLVDDDFEFNQAALYAMGDASAAA